VVKDDQTVETRPVKLASTLTAQTEQGEVIVQEGLRPGERVVAEGQFKLQEGSKVRLADAAGEGEIPSPKGKGKGKS